MFLVTSDTDSIRSIALRKRSFLSALATVALGAGLLVGTSVPASAGAIKCVGADGPAGTTLCFSVSGSKLKVDNYRINFTMPGSNICNRRTVFTGVTTANSFYSKWSPYQSGCILVNTYGGTTIGKSFKNGTSVTGQQEIKGDLVAGIARVGIKG